MKSSVYVSSEKVDVIGYVKAGTGVAVKGYVTAPLPEGTMINGKIIDSAHLTETLSALRVKAPELFAEPSLIVDGASIQTRRDTAPKLSPRQFEQFVRDGFAETAENVEELACAWRVLGSAEGGGTSFFACAVDRAQVESYIATFRSAGIKLQSIHVGTQALMHYIGTRPDILMHTFVLNVIDGVMMLSMVVDNGVSVFISRTRLYGDSYEQTIQHILGNLPGLISFNRSQKFNEITHSYYMGLNPEDLDLMRQISPYPDILLNIPNLYQGVKGGETLTPTAHFAFLNTLMGPKSIDLMQSLKELDKRKRRNKPKKLWIPLIAGMLALVAVISGVLGFQAFQYARDIDEINQYLEDPGIVSKVQELDAIRNETVVIQQAVDQLRAKEEQDAAKALMSVRMLNVIEETQRDWVRIVSISFDENQSAVHVNGSSPTETGIAEFVRTLKLSEWVKDVKYTGYGPAGDGYSFSLSITLAAAGEVAP